jgi:UDP-N-acetyl-D-galactosamine dehydrogenase
MMKNRIDPSNELEAEDFDGCDILFTANPADLHDCHFHIVAVPHLLMSTICQILHL